MFDKMLKILGTKLNPVLRSGGQVKLFRLQRLSCPFWRLSRVGFRLNLIAVVVLTGLGVFPAPLIVK